MKTKKRDFSTISPTANVVLNIIFIIYSALCIIPFLLILGISVSDENSLVNYGYHIIPKTFSNAAYLFVTRESTALLRSYGITIYATVSGTLLCVIITALFAYPLSRKDFKYRNLFSFIVFFTMIFHGGLIAGYMVYVQLLGLKNNLLVYLMPFLMSAWNVIILRTFFSSSIPDSIVEAAKIDGAGELSIFVKIVLPLSLPGLATIALFTSIGLWNDWYTPLLYITKPKLYNLQYLLYNTLTNVSYLQNNAELVGSEAAKILQHLPTLSIRMAMCIFSIGPIILAYPFFQKYFVKGLTVGAVKG
jgi:putative aldouronate transport system permease protein